MKITLGMRNPRQSRSAQLITAEHRGDFHGSRRDELRGIGNDIASVFCAPCSQNDTPSGM